VTNSLEALLINGGINRQLQFIPGVRHGSSKVVRGCGNSKSKHENIFQPPKQEHK